jgi:hypothetical protein
MSFFSFDTSSYDPAKDAPSDFSLIPAGQYICQIIDSEVKDTKAGDGKYLQLTWEVLDGEYRGRRIFERINFLNKNRAVQDRAEKDISSICFYSGVQNPNSPHLLHYKPVKLRIIIKKSKDAAYGDSNAISGRDFANVATAPTFTAPSFQHPPQQQAAPAANTPPPWAAAAGKAA